MLFSLPSTPYSYLPFRSFLTLALYKIHTFLSPCYYLCDIFHIKHTFPKRCISLLKVWFLNIFIQSCLLSIFFHIRNKAGQQTEDKELKLWSHIQCRYVVNPNTSHHGITDEDISSYYHCKNKQKSQLSLNSTEILSPSTAPILFLVFLNSSKSF